MKIYTRKGDDGTTSLWYGGRVAKNDARTEAYGSLDEAASALGVARALATDERLRADILRLQDELFVAGAELATAPEARERLEAGVSRLDDGMVDVARAGDRRLHGRGRPAAEVRDPRRHAAVGPARRRAVGAAPRGAPDRGAASSAQDLGDSAVLEYVNRASDLLFAMARFADVPEPELFEGRGRSSAEAK